jgi:hypothetical protein
VISSRLPTIPTLRFPWGPFPSPANNMFHQLVRLLPVR